MTVGILQSQQGLGWVEDSGDQTFCKTWAGLTCNNAGKVIAVNLTKKNLNGPLPAQFGQLTSLQSVNLDDNFFQGKHYCWPNLYNMPHLVR